MNYMKKTINRVSIIGENIIEKNSTWLDASYAVNDDMKSQTVVKISFGYGTV